MKARDPEANPWHISPQWRPPAHSWGFQGVPGPNGIYNPSSVFCVFPRVFSQWDLPIKPLKGGAQGASTTSTSLFFYFELPLEGELFTLSLRLSLPIFGKFFWSWFIYHDHKEGSEHNWTGKLRALLFGPALYYKKPEQSLRYCRQRPQICLPIPLCILLLLVNKIPRYISLSDWGKD